ncbi:MAG TPA: SusC/RagA family TonB-linked outer membrane protein, partial [Flavisolibacter sp.]|nr:SusC/RagA family TonB-linked outer membrane protein [Flavisolibacter sp.]
MEILVTPSRSKAAVLIRLLSTHAKASLLLLLFSAFFVSPLLAQNTITVRGRVVDEKNQPVALASVTVKGTANGTTTNDNGEYQLSAPANGTLVISSIGFPTKEIPVAGQATHNVTLTASSTDLEQVVVVGYGTQRKEAVTGSVASVNAAAIREVPSANIAQALQGRIAGVEMAPTSSVPGASMQIRIRGTRSLTASNDPLVVLDGIPFPGSLSDINPNDIKSVDILKDASATAIYGSRGANGVILITTNRGQRNQKPRISYNAYYGAQTLFARYPMMKGPEFAALRKAAGMFSTQPGGDESDSLNTDWQDMFYRTGMVTSHDVNLSGGTQQGSYSFGLGYYLNQSVIPTQQYKRYSLRASVDQQVGKNFRFGFTTNNNYNLSEGNQVGLYGVLSMSPLVNPYRTDGSLKRTVKMPLDEQWVMTRDVVENLKDQWLNQNRGYATYNAIYGEVQIPWVKGLKYRANLGLDFNQNNGGNYTGQGVNSINLLTPSTAGVSNSQNFHWTLENLLTYDRTFGGKHSINAVALYSAEQNKYNRSSMSAKDIPADAFQFYNLGQATGEITIDPNGQDYQLSGLLSWMG